MKPSDASRRMLLLLLALIPVIFAASTLPVISPAHAAILSAALPTLEPTHTPFATDDTSLLPPGPSETPPPTPAPTPTPFRVPVAVPTDMTGLIGLAILVVVVTLVGMVWGGAPARRKRAAKK